ncbi:hypothetical protein G3580_16865 [Nitrogeniibacter mangrovi]|uniref:Uncharacterized protein n=1 Tax=Nitrogeniibacter mangrovi TaxID=2016596 RepID=A0A6C1B705_9RHOO|nr:hypothetical protein [Nitrogeniibacter mangrovi]QID19143.1 hypothetical protein G3580_16865 [Nitrogeniibacter mangrovi]
MKTRKLIGRLRLWMTGPPAETPRRKLRKALRELKARQRALEAELERTDGLHARQRLRQKIEVLRAQRQKGVRRYRAIRAD